MEQAQRIAAKAVRRVLAGVALGAALEEAGASKSGERALATELAYGTLRFLGQVRTAVRMLAERPLTDPSIEALLWVALYQLIHTTAPAHAVVDSAVRVTGQLKRTSAKGLTNAILRTFLRRRESLLREISSDAEGRYSYQRWWIDRIFAEYAASAPEILDAGNARPPLTLRVNCRETSREEYLDALRLANIAASPVGPSGVIVAEPRRVEELPGYAEGWFSVQDAGAQVAAPLLDAHDGMRVLDACAAPGGKTTHLAEFAELELVALDHDEARLERVADNLSRLRLTAKLHAADAADTDAWWDGIAFDRILLDAPCTASGVVRRHPDGKWLRRESDIDGFVAQQKRLLDALWPCLKSDGKLLYATCSIFGAENKGQIDAFVLDHRDASRAQCAISAEVGADGGQLLPAGAGAAHNHDGFFYALLQKT
ncbi:MAG TPA: 16S rRNA (cytosine(967)-C(5))-methyltransferase RsmB [Casimicrobiaceae bacterium]|nr:16S rRNA (cytosine(967)-C(5))-methyltransferase RsmB [Casimicrobiaceae bacterium]